MVRRSTVDRSPQPVAHAAGYSAETGDLAPDVRQVRGRTAKSWSGAGGRWLVWTFRAVVWAVLLIVGYRGVTAIVLGETSAPPTTGAHRPASTFPVSLAGAYALQFGQVYLNASPSTAAQRAASLAAFLPPGTDPQLGWNGTGSLQLQSEQIAGVHVDGSHRGVVTLLARVSGHLMELGVPIYAAGGRLAVSGEPSWLPAPRRAPIPSAAPINSDPATQALLMKELPAFFQAYASGNQVTLSRFLAPGTTLAGLGGDVSFGALTQVTVPAGGAKRHIVATVRWRVTGTSGGSQIAGSPAAGLEMTYALTIVRRSGTWYVSHIGPSARAAGPP